MIGRIFAVAILPLLFAAAFAGYKGNVPAMAGFSGWAMAYAIAAYFKHESDVWREHATALSSDLHALREKVGRG